MKEKMNKKMEIGRRVEKGNKKKKTIGEDEKVNSVVATRDWTFKRKRNLTEATTRDTKAPNELVDADDVLLMRFGGKCNGGSPSAMTFSDPTIGFENFQMLHDDLAFMGSAVWLLATNRTRSISVSLLYSSDAADEPLGLDSVVGRIVT